MISVEWKVTGVTTLPEDIQHEDAETQRPENNGVVALLNLASSQLAARSGEEPLFAIARAYGILRYLATVTFGISEDNVIFEKGMLEGMELANVYSSHFGKKVAGRYWLTLHESDPREGAPSMLPDRHGVYMIDITGNGEIVNISDVDINVTNIGKSLKFVGVWDDEQDGTLIDVGEFQVPLDLDGRSELCFSAGGIRTNLQDA